MAERRKTTRVVCFTLLPWVDGKTVCAAWEMGRVRRAADRMKQIKFGKVRSAVIAVAATPLQDRCWK